MSIPAQTLNAHHEQLGLAAFEKQARKRDRWLLLWLLLTA